MASTPEEFVEMGEMIAKGVEDGEHTQNTFYQKNLKII